MLPGVAGAVAIPGKGWAPCRQPIHTKGAEREHWPCTVPSSPLPSGKPSSPGFRLLPRSLACLLPGSQEALTLGQGTRAMRRTPTQGSVSQRTSFQNKARVPDREEGLLRGSFTDMNPNTRCTPATTQPSHGPPALGIPPPPQAVGISPAPQPRPASQPLAKAPVRPLGSGFLVIKVHTGSI